MDGSSFLVEDLVRSLCLRFWNQICICLGSTLSCCASFALREIEGNASALKTVSRSALAAGEGAHRCRFIPTEESGARVFVVGVEERVRLLAEAFASFPPEKTLGGGLRAGGQVLL